MVFHFLFNLIPLLPPLHLITPHPVEKNIPEEEVFLHVSETSEKDTVTMAAASVEPGRSKSDHESVCAVPCEFYISLILICWKWSCQGHVEIKCCSMVVNIEEEEKKLSTCWGLHGISDVAYRLGQSTGS